MSIACCSRARCCASSRSIGPASRSSCACAMTWLQHVAGSPSSKKSDVTVRSLLAASPVVLAPMEDVTDAAFRRICRSLGADVCITEFIAAEQVIADSALARRRAYLAPDDRPTAIQIYGHDPAMLLAAAQIAAAAEPAF